jgi:hypothetical protein
MKGIATWFRTSVGAVVMMMMMVMVVMMTTMTAV